MDSHNLNPMFNISSANLSPQTSPEPMSKKALEQPTKNVDMKDQNEAEVITDSSMPPKEKENSDKAESDPGSDQPNSLNPLLAQLHAERTMRLRGETVDPPDTGGGSFGDLSGYSEVRLAVGRSATLLNACHMRYFKARRIRCGAFTCPTHCK